MNHKDVDAVIRHFERMEKIWPDGLMVLASGGRLLLIDKSKYDPAAIPESAIYGVYSIPSDGGDPEFAQEEASYD